MRSIAEALGLSPAAISAMTLEPIIQDIGFPLLQGVQHGVLPIGIYHRIRRRFGQQYCPLCLKRVPPYLRRSWRFQFAIACLNHQVRLCDACPHCDAPFIPHRHQSLLSTTCFRCGKSLTDIDPAAAQMEAMHVQRHLMARIYPNVEPGNQNTTSSLSTPDLFEGVRLLCRLILAVDDAQRPSTDRVVWAFQRVIIREGILRLAANLIADWPGKFLDWAESRHLSQAGLAEIGSWPEWIAGPIRSLPISHVSRSARPRKRRIVRLSQLRRVFPNRSTYREQRAKLLIGDMRKELTSASSDE